MTNIHSTAVIEKGAKISDDVVIGPYCTVGPNVTLGNGTRLISHVVVDGWTTIGRDCTIFPFACIGTQTQDLKFKGERTFVEIGDRTTLREYVTVNSSTNEGEVTKVGSDCHIMAYCHVAHQCDVGNQVIMSNAATLAGHVIVEEQAIVGGLSGVHQFVRIGRLCMVGGCTKVVKDCPPFMIIDGNPATVHGPNRIGMERREVSVDAQKSLKDAYRTVYRMNLPLAEASAKIREKQASTPELEHFLSFIESSERGITR